MSDATINPRPAARVSVVTWDECQIARDQADWLRQEDPGLTEDEAFDLACEDSERFADAWQAMLEVLTETLREIAPEGRFHAEGRNMGWRRRRGVKDFTALDGGAFLRELLPDTDCTFVIEREGTALHITNWHHDAPTGEFYSVVPDCSEPGGAP